MPNRPTAILTEAQVVEILDLLKVKVSHQNIADRYGVSKKSISRIATGETWRDISLRYGLQTPPSQTIIPVINLVPIPTEFCDLLDEITAVKNHFALSFTHPLYWGQFSSWDGVHSIVSDGYIIWESLDLYNYAKRLSDTKIIGYPVWSEKTEELPTFELEDFMTQPVGDKFTVNSGGGDIVKLVSSNKELFIRAKYVTMAIRMKLDIREAQTNDSFVYLTKNKPKATSDPMPIVIACATVLND
jgi:hypothetical protein